MEIVAKDSVVLEMIEKSVIVEEVVIESVSVGIGDDESVTVEEEIEGSNVKVDVMEESITVVEIEDTVIVKDVVKGSVVIESIVEESVVLITDKSVIVEVVELFMIIKDDVIDGMCVVLVVEDSIAVENSVGVDKTSVGVIVDESDVVNEVLESIVIKEAEAPVVDNVVGDAIIVVIRSSSGNVIGGGSGVFSLDNEAVLELAVVRTEIVGVISLVIVVLLKLLEVLRVLALLEVMTMVGVVTLEVLGAVVDMKVMVLELLTILELSVVLRVVVKIFVLLEMLVLLLRRLDVVLEGRCVFTKEVDIHEGVVVLVERNLMVDDGDLVVMLVGRGCVVKGDIVGLVDLGHGLEVVEVFIVLKKLVLDVVLDPILLDVQGFLVVPDLENNMLVLVVEVFIVEVDCFGAVLNNKLAKYLKCRFETLTYELKLFGQRTVFFGDDSPGGAGRFSALCIWATHPVISSTAVLLQNGQYE